MRPIDADALFQEIASLNISLGGVNVFIAPAKQSVLDSIDNQETLDYVPRQQWISVKDRLPDEGIDVLMQFEQNMTVGFRLECDWYAYTDDGFYTSCDSKATHWMPLPKPPKEE